MEYAMQDLVNDIVAALRPLATEGRVLHVGEGCGADTIASLEERIGWTLPADYREFLRMTNGLRIADEYESVFIDLHEAKDLPVPIDDDQRETLGADGVDLGRSLIVGRVPMHNLYVFIDQDTSETVRWTDWEATRYSSFGAFLHAEAQMAR